MARRFPRLYKMSNGGKLQVWEIEATTWSGGDVWGVVRTRWGQEDGLWQETEDVIREGKNVGKKNATTAEKQAELEAEAKWRKQIERRGYVEDRERALAKENDAEGGIAPMLAKLLEETKKITFPCRIQRKYNGVRMIAVVEDGKCTLWSRKQTSYTPAFPHIVAAYEAHFKGRPGKYIFDGEAYRHGWSLQKISGYARVKEPKEGHEQIKHYVYDLPSCKAGWQTREHDLGNLIWNAGQKIVMVESENVADMKQVKAWHDKWVQDGYEGVILRNLEAPYEFGKRSYQLAKYKEYKEQEFKIVGFTDGRGKFEGCCVFVCATKDGKEFECCAPGTLEDRAEWFRRAPEVIGKPLTVKYFEWSEDGKPLQPVGMAVRDYE